MGEGGWVGEGGRVDGWWVGGWIGGWMGGGRVDGASVVRYFNGGRATESVFGWWVGR